MARAPGASIESNTELSCSNLTATSVVFGTANWQKPSTGWFSGANPDRLTIQADGLYLVTWSLFVQAGNGSGLRRAYLQVNGSNPSPLCEDRCAASSQAITLGESVQLELVTGDTIQIKFWHNDGANLKIGSNTSTYKNRMEVVKLSDVT